jgi:hypothetical protein
MTAPGSSGVVFLLLLYLGVVFAFAAKEFRSRLAQAGAATPPGLQLPFAPKGEDESDPDEDATADGADEEEMQPVPGTVPGGKTYRE